MSSLPWLLRKREVCSILLFPVGGEFSRDLWDTVKEWTQSILAQVKKEQQKPELSLLGTTVHQPRKQPFTWPQTHFTHENMVVKTRKQNVKDQAPQASDKDRSPLMSTGTGKSRRTGKDGKGTSFNSLLQNKNGLFLGNSLIRNKLGFTLALGTCHHQQLL